MKKITSGVFIFFGFVFLGLGMLGIAVPVLPTTPFLLLTAYCFVKGSDRFDRWFKGTKIYKKYLEDFVREKAMTRRQKITINLFADAMIAIPFFTIDKITVKVILLLVVIIKYYYFITQIKTIKGDETEVERPFNE